MAGRVAPSGTRPPSEAPGRMMRALVQDRYGTSDVLRIAEVQRPVPRAGEVLVRVEAASVNARDWHIMRGEPRIARLMDRSIFGWRGPRTRVRGTDFAGVVEAAGPGVAGIKPGDRVFGEANATLAEYVAAPVSSLARIPDGVSMEQAAALPLAATTALECVRSADPAPGSTALIIGASGGVGTFAVQLARSMDLDVTAVCSARNTEQAHLLGACRVIDYAKEDFTATGASYDLVVDLVGNRSLGELTRVVAPTGSLVLSGGGVPDKGRLIGAVGLLIRAQVAHTRKGLNVLIPQVVPTHDTLGVLADLVIRGVIRAQIERTYGFESAADALRHLDTEHARGKVVVSTAR